MRSLTADHARILSLPRRRVDRKVEVRREDGSWTNLCDLLGRDWVTDLQWSADIDTPYVTASASLHREHYHLSLAPLIETSRLNLNGAGTYSPAVDLGREWRFSTYVGTHLGREAPTWMPAFHGVVESDGSAQTPMTISGRDLGGLLIDAMIETEAKYGSALGVPAETVLQSFHTDNSTGVTVYTPTSPLWLITPEYTQQRMSVMEAGLGIAEKIGWWARYKWDEGTQSWRFTFYTVDRAKTTPDHSFGPNDYRAVSRLDRNLLWVRNKLRIGFLDAATGERAYVSGSDPASIAKYGGPSAIARYMEQELGADSLVRSAAEATAMLNAELSDLSEPKAEVEVELPFFPHAELGDLFGFAANPRLFTTPQTWAVVGYRHQLSTAADGATTDSTTLTLRGKPAGYSTRWFGLDTRVKGTGADGIATLQRPLISYNGASFTVELEGDVDTASLWYQERVAGVWGAKVLVASARKGSWTDTASTSAKREYRVFGENAVDVAGPAITEVFIDKHVPGALYCQCSARITASDATTVTVEVSATPAGAEIFLRGVSGSAVKASGPNVGVSSPNPTTWVFTRGAINAGAGQARFEAVAAGYTDDTDLVEIEEQGRDTVPLLMRATVTSATDTQVVVRVAVADPFPGGDITLTYDSHDVGGVSPSSPQTMLLADVTADIATTGYVDFTVTRATGAGSGRVTFTATRSGRTSDSDAVDVPASGAGAPSAAIAPNTGQAAHRTTITLAYSGAVATGVSGNVQYRVRKVTGDADTAWPGFTSPGTTSFSTTEAVTRDDVYTTIVQLEVLDAAGRSTVVSYPLLPKLVGLTDDGKLKPEETEPGTFPTGVSGREDFSVGDTVKHGVARHKEDGNKLHGGTLTFGSSYDAIPTVHAYLRKGTPPSGTKFEVTAIDVTVSSAKARAVSISGESASPQTDYFALTLNGTEDAGGRTLSTENAEAFSSLNGANSTSTLYSVLYNVNTTLMGATETLYVEVHKNAGASSTSWTKVGEKPYAAGVNATGEVIPFTAALGADWDIRVLVFTQGGSGGFSVVARQVDFNAITPGTETSLASATDDRVYMVAYEAP